MYRIPSLAAAILLAGCPAKDEPVDTDVGPESDTDPGLVLATRAPVPEVPVDPLEGTGVEGCVLIEQTRCEGGEKQVCAIYDVDEAVFPVSPDAGLRRAFLYDRWFDLYHSPDGQTANREMDAGFAPGTPEADWSDPEAFDRWDGFGDSAIWTAIATNAAMWRWLTTGTAADRARFERQLRASLTQFEVTGVEGYLARAHFLAVPDGTPASPEHLVLTTSQAEDPIRFVARDPSAAPDLPAAYATGVPDGQGGIATGTVMWQGNPSIDQYTGPMTVYPTAFGLVDASLQDRIATQMTCYLKRLDRYEIRNLQGNPELLEAALAALGGAGGAVDEDLDVESLDTIVLFALPAYNKTNEDDDPGACPEGLPVEPVATLDATSDTFVPDLLTLAARLAKGFPNGIDHLYAPSVRGGDAVHLLHLAAMGWHMTGDEAYKRFFEEDLVAGIGALSVANSLGSLVQNPWCRPFFGDHITLPPLWALIGLLDEGPVRDELVRALVEEGHGRIADGLANAKFDLMIADRLPEGDPLRDALLDEVRDVMAVMGGNGGDLDDPRRTYTLLDEDYEALLGADFDPVCPTGAQRASCEDGLTVLGITVPGESITHPCAGMPSECDLGDGQCAWPMNATALPPTARAWEDFLWQRNPFKLYAVYGEEGRRSSPGLDLAETTWLARHRGVLGDGARQVLAWKDDGTCP